MKNALLMMAGFAACAAAAIASTGFDFTTSAQRNVRGWEYAAVTGMYLPYSTDNPSAIVVGGANICYMNAQGCTNEEVRYELSFSKFLQDLKRENNDASRWAAQRRAMEFAFARAVAKLGSEGWEMVSSPEVQFDNYVLSSPNSYTLQEGNGRDRHADVYFKRARQ